MSQIVFPSLPDTTRLPFAYCEFDSTGASEDLSLNPFTVLIAAQMLETGKAIPLEVTRPTSVHAARDLFGRGSMAARMVEAYLSVNPVTKMLVIPCLDDETGEPATGRVHFEGSVDYATPLCLYIGGQLVKAAARTGTTAAEAASALRDAINAAPDLFVIASTQDATLVLTAKHAGECGNDLDIRWGYNDEAFPGGLSGTITPMSGGAGNPDAMDIVTAMGNERFHFISWPWRDKASLEVLKDAMDSRWGPIRQIDGQVVVSHPGTFGEAVTFSGGYNNKHITVLPTEKSLTPTWEDAASSMGLLAYYGNQDPSRGFNTIANPWLLAPHKRDRFSDFPEKNQGLFEGLSTRYVDADGNVCFSNVITTYRINPLGAEDKAFLSINSPLTLSYLRYDWNNHLKLKFPRWKLAGDDAKGENIMKPKIGMTEAISRFQRWLDAGLVEGVAQFKKDLIVARNTRNENRMDWFFRPNLVNQFNVAGTVMRHIV